MIHFKGKKIVIMGLGLHGGGAGSAEFFARQGARVMVTDLKTRKELKESIDRLKGLNIRYVLGKHRKEDFIKADLIIKNPDVPSHSPFLRAAKRHKVPIETDVGLFFKISGAFIIGITGTKGKSTTATLIYKLLRSRYRNTFLAGNIGISPLKLIPRIEKSKKNRLQEFIFLKKKKRLPIAVLELSSFELEDLKESPDIAVVTNILEDHMNRYKNASSYIKFKKRIFKFQDKNDILILNYDDPIVKDFSSKAKSKVYFFNIKELKNKYNTKEFILSGEHNFSNISAAIKVAKLLKVSDRKILNVLKAFKGVPYRQEFIRNVRGVRYFNDTTATMPDAVSKAIKALSPRVLIAGGQDKGLDYTEMAQEIDKNNISVVLLPGTGSKKLKKELSSKVFPAESMKEAVKKAYHLAQKGDTVLLSPGAASFNLFKNEFDRGDQFNKWVRKL